MTCVSSVNERKRLLAAYHEGLGESEVGKALSAHRGRDTLEEILRKRYFRYDMRRSDIENYVKRCDACQRVNPKMRTEKPALHCVTMPKAAFHQVGIDLISLPETAEGFKYVVVLADYPKYPEAMALKDKTGQASLALSSHVCASTAALPFRSTTKALNLSTRFRQRCTV